MVNVLHFDYQPHMTAEAIYALQKRIHEFLDIQYQLLNPQLGMQGFDYNRSELERLLPDQDVLLIHPGTKGQLVVMEEYPRRYTNLRIGILSFSEGDYDGTRYSGRVQIFSYMKPDKVIQFILEKKTGSS